ncbi:M1 family metallopeptidase [Chitinophaga pinensis]|uniref:Peptidase M1 membrane alanine aminopeptidase n=1 Tax=Chitinophaga pinensis (strain ATCC 43595 / DSM 2588 / LMG 13176 / NBRC 15968 / NCIMB 11800 / UQM 2034) TaxID=485918 RepID=A0A979G637_CHIPD|nr:M1 family metallopeptidase [Chitinophaga pinensis]ACU61501.1 Peptidase M1 membrane alanine aminopeptidase [Chitinophaga pinensis DSM 2588]
MRGIPMLLLVLLTALSAGAQHQTTFTRADTLRGSITRERAWWDVKSYHLQVKPSLSDSTISGSNTITYKVLKVDSIMQIDLQEPLQVDSILQDKQSVPFKREGNVILVDLVAKKQVKGKTNKIYIAYHGKPRVAKNAPWDGGLVWTKDKQNRPWVATACQGLGASVWWPNKDHQSDEPDNMTISVTTPPDLVDVSNGRLKKKALDRDGNMVWTWYVSNPINNYDVAMNIGHYTEFKDTYSGEGGKLELGYWVMDYNVDTAKTHFAVVKDMLKCFEFWFGKYPFYKDSYKLVESPHLGMEHQSAVAYGNKFQMGYKGTDLSGSGWGLKWDFIIVHESGHEWFGNNITTKDIADMWVHESFTNYSETLFIQCQFGKEAAFDYITGIRKNIRNDIPIIGAYGVNNEGSGDMYYKGANMIHTIRQVVNNDDMFREILRGLNKTFYHQTVTTRQVEEFFNQKTNMNFNRVFEQYLMHTSIPTLEYHFEGSQLKFRWVTDVENFNMPVKVTLTDNGYTFIYPGRNWQSMTMTLSDRKQFKVDPNFYINVKEI